MSDLHSHYTITPMATTQYQKPAKPAADFPLFPHACGKWAKKINGKLYYFGHWGDPWAAFTMFSERFPDLVPAGITTLESVVSSGEIQQNTKKAKTRRRAGRPYPTFPLYPHASGQWMKRIRGKYLYFGPLRNPEAALALYERERPYWERGETPPSRVSSGDDNAPIGLRDLCNLYLEDAQKRVEATTLQKRSFNDYARMAATLRDFFGAGKPVASLRPSDFARLANEWKHLAPKTREGWITKVKIILNWGASQTNAFYPAINFGDGFKKPSAIEKRVAQELTGRQMFEPDQILALLNEATVELKAMILLGINCAFITVDCGLLSPRFLDLENGYHHFPRLKTWQKRHCPLWPETVEALKIAIKQRKKPKDPEAVAYMKRVGKEEWCIRQRDLVFVTKYGQPWITRNTTNPVSQEVRKLMKAAGVPNKRLNFGSLRHTFATVAGDTLDGYGVSYIMGHVAKGDDMKMHYTRRMSDERLKKTTNYVRDWLFKRTPPLAWEAEKPAVAEGR